MLPKVNDLKAQARSRYWRSCSAGSCALAANEAAIRNCIAQVSTMSRIQWRRVLLS